MKKLLATNLLAGILCGIAVGGLGWYLLTRTLGDGLTRFSYDFPFLLRPTITPTEAVVVYLDEHSYEQIGLTPFDRWPRELHGALIDRLKELGAKVVVFDIVFDGAGPSPEGDEALAKAIANHGNVVLGGTIGMVQDPGMEPVMVATEPYQPFAEAAAAWGLAQFPEDRSTDLMIRQHLMPGDGRVSLSWAAATAGGHDLPEPDDIEHRLFWVNYYGQRGSVPGISYASVLQEDGVPEGFFEGKTVFIGQYLDAGLPGQFKDDFSTPFSRVADADSRAATPGVEVHATMFLNLIRHEWLERMAAWLEMAVIVGGGFLIGLGLNLCRPFSSILLAGALSAGTGGTAYWLFADHHLWFAWAIGLVQIGAAAVWAVAFNSLKLYVDRKLLLQSLAFHVSPSRVKQILKDPSILQPGGKEQMVSILFSDIENFSTHAEKLEPGDLFKMLNDYYERALNCLHETDGTIVQLIGDAIFAVWNAPVEQEDHKKRAIRTALKLHEQLISFDAENRTLPLRTRVGIHSGVATVGNLGSQKRFDFATIGDSVNLSARLEGLNKHLGTSILATRATQKAMEDELVSRMVGHFSFKGFGRSVEVHELIGTGKRLEEKCGDWIDAFGNAMFHFQRAQFEEARNAFLQTIELRHQVESTNPEDRKAPDDGPSTFYLAEIDRLLANPPPQGWAGEINMREK